MISGTARRLISEELQKPGDSAPDGYAKLTT